MRYLSLLNQTKIENLTFESRYLPGGVVGGRGSEEVYPQICLKNGRKINDLCVGFRICTEDKFAPGETVGNCLNRHGASIEDVERIVVSIVDMMTTKVIKEKFVWTHESGWVEEV
jgi:hypothetical protein